MGGNEPTGMYLRRVGVDESVRLLGTDVNFPLIYRFFSITMRQLILPMEVCRAKRRLYAKKEIYC